MYGPRKGAYAAWPFLIDDIAMMIAYEGAPSNPQPVSVLSDQEIFKEIQRLRTIAESVEKQNPEL